MALPPLAPIATSTDEPVLGRYELTSELLGEGGYGKVVLAHDISITPRGRVAAKVLELSGGLTPAQVLAATARAEILAHRDFTSRQSLRPCLPTRQVQRELDAHRAVQKGEACEFVLSLLADAPHANAHAHLLFLELCGGGDLLDRVLDCGGLAEPHAATLFAQVAAAVAHCHGRGVAHRDIKLENILLTTAGHARLGDLGLAAITPLDGGDGGFGRNNGHGGGRAWCSEFAGSPSYAAPEVWLAVDGDKPYDPFAAECAWPSSPRVASHHCHATASPPPRCR